MPTTTVLNEDTATIVSDGDSPRRFNWSAAFAGAFVATAVTFFLLTLGSGVGLSLVSVRHATSGDTTTFLTLGAIYFLAAQAFGFAAGGHIVGRLIGPAIETSREEEIRAGMHGLVAWSLAVVATATLVALSVLVAGSATANGAMNGALASTAARGEAPSPATAYWVDTLFRSPASSMQASLAGRRYAQVDTGTATDGTGAPPEQPAITPETSEAPLPPTRPAAGPGPVFMDAAAPPSAASPPALLRARSIAADKAEAGRILAVGMANGGRLSSEDHTQLAWLIAQDTPLSLGAAQARVTDVAARIRRDEIAAADTARKTAAYASLWTAFALLFGAVIAAFAAISARWEDDKESGLLPGTRVETLRL
ncbi:MAG TPA: hypothetical protein VGC36_13010 [Rhizomicrobium sp.]